jgi:ribosome-binding protein aMBF1 (putative translation factor)
MRTKFRRHPHTQGPAVAQAYVRMIKEAREAAGLTQGQAAERIGMDRANWGVIERGVTGCPGIDKVSSMAEAVGLRLVLVPADESPLTTEEMTIVARLVQWYIERPGTRRLPPALITAIRKLAPYTGAVKS